MAQMQSITILNGSNAIYYKNCWKNNLKLINEKDDAQSLKVKVSAGSISWTKKSPFTLHKKKNSTLQMPTKLHDLLVPAFTSQKKKKKKLWS